MIINVAFVNIQIIVKGSNFGASEPGVPHLFEGLNPRILEINLLHNLITQDKWNPNVDQLNNISIN